MATAINTERARGLVLEFGWNATAYQIVNPGIEYWFSARDDAVVGYVRKKGVRVVAGAPVCSFDRLPEVLEEWQSASDSARDRVCYFGAAGRINDLLDPRKDYSTVILGSQPVWKPAHWAEIIGGVSSLRAQFSRARNKGVEVSEWPPEKATLNPELQRVLDEWLHTRGLPTLHFLVEPHTLSLMEDRRTFVATRDGKVVAFTVLCPIAQRNGWLTEQFPRGFDAPNGTVELLMDCAIKTVAGEGAEYVTMGLVPLSQLGSASQSHNPLWLEVLLSWVRAHGRRFYNFDGLEAFKSKFRPEDWEPIYAISHEPKFSFRSLYAIAAAFTLTSPVAAVGRGLLRAARQEKDWLLNRLE